MSDEQFITTKILDGDILVIKLHGRLDVVTTPEFNSEIEHHFEQGKHKVIIDCAHLGHISSVGIGALVSLQAKLRKKGGAVKLAAIQSGVSDVLQIVRLDKVVDIYADTEFAHESFQES